MFSTVNPARRAIDPCQPLALSCDRYLKIESFCVRDLYDFEHIYRVEMEVVEMPDCRVFDVSVTIYWERFSESDPQTHLMISLARSRLRDYFNGGACPRLCSQRYGVALEYPPAEDLPAY